jgi:hypothetical protein
MMVEVSLALVISALAAFGTVRELVRTQALQSAVTEADALAMYRQALQDYVDENYTALQFGTPVTRNGVTLVAGAAVGQAMQPSVADLRNMGYLNAGFANVSITVDGGTYQNVIQRQPAGCVNNACNILGLAYLSGPVVVRGGAGASNSLIIGQMISRLGGLGGASVEGSTVNVTGSGGAWTWPNPVAATPAGVVGARFGFGSSTLAGYVRLNDNRDPNLQGNLTVAGNTTVNNLTINGATTLNGAVTTTDDISARNVTASQNIRATGSISSQTSVGASDTVACLRAALEAGGNLVSRALDCVTRVQISNAGVAVNSATGVNRINLDGTTGLLAVNTAAGAQNIGLDGATGRVSSQRLRVSTTAARGAACTDADDVVTDVDVTGTLLVCKGGVWRSPGGLVQAVEATACTSLGSLARNATDQALICRFNGTANAWASLNDRVTTAVTVDVWSANGVAAVPVPACGAGGTADISVAALQGGSDYGVVPPRNRFEVRVSGTGPWSVSPALVDQTGTAYTSDSLGNPYSLGWTATTFCRYPG